MGAFVKMFLVVTGGGGVTPLSWPGKIVLMSWSFCGLLMVSAYTANLVSFLTSKQQPEPITDLGDLMSAKAQVCIPGGGGAMESWWRGKYPSYTRYTMIPGTADASVIALNSL